jgi:tetratricopeptide (TPR) repeat protein
MTTQPLSVQSSGQGSIAVGCNVSSSLLVTSSQNVIIQAGQVMFQDAEQARAAGRDPAHMLRILAVLAAPVYNPRQPDSLPPPLDLKQEWHELAQRVRVSRAPILLTRIVPPTLDALRRALSPRAEEQAIFPHILHFSGHAWREGLFLEDELGQVHAVTTEELLDALRSLPRPLDLVVLNGCETAADARSVAQALVAAGLARAVVGHPRKVYDLQAVHFAACLYAELTSGITLKEAVKRAQQHILKEAVKRAQQHITTPSQPSPSQGKGRVGVVRRGDPNLRFERFTGGEPWIDDRRPSGNLPSQPGHFFGRGPQLVDIAKALAHPPKIVVLSGPAAIGKSTLALEAAHRNAWRFPGGVAFAEGPRAEENRPGAAADILNRLAEALGMRPEPERVAEALWLYTARQPTLLMLDNLETLPAAELDCLRRVLERLGGESAALVLARPPQPPLEDLSCAHPIPLHEGIGLEAALLYALRLADERSIPLNRQQAAEIAAATDGHPRLIELVVAQARRRDLAALLQEVRERRGDFRRQLDALYAWSAARLDDAGRAAWAALPLFPAGNAPEGPLRAAAGEGLEALREAALADFDPALQLWRWHGTVAEYARLHWPLAEEERLARLSAVLPAWTEWLEGLAPETPATALCLEVGQANLDLVLAHAPRLPVEGMRKWLAVLHRALPAPDRTLSLRPFEEAVYRTWAGLAAEKGERAGVLVMLGRALSALGRREEALTATQEAVDIYRGLAQVNPQVFLPDLATSLNNLGNRLSDLGRREEALTATQEAVDIRRKLAEQNRQAFLPDLAMSLNNLGRALSALGRREEALAATEEAVEIRRKLAQENPPAFLPDLALSLNNLGNALSALGQREEALTATQEAVEIRRKLAQQNPQAFLPDLALSLTNLGSDLSALGRREEALAATQEAADLYRDLARANTPAFLPNLATSLNNLGRDLSALGRREEALAATQEAADLYRDLARANPQAFLPDLAATLNNLGNRLSALGRREEALAATQEAVKIYRQLAQQNPQAFLPDLARSLGAHGSVLRGLGRHAEAAAAFAEGLRAILPFVRALPAAFGGLADALLQYYLWACQEAGEAPDAGLVEEVLQVIGQPVAIHPAVVGLAPLLLAVAAMAQGAAGPEVAGAVEEALAGMRQQEEWRALAEALGRLLAGERDPQALRRGLALDEVDERALALAEGAVAGDERALVLLAALGGD